MNKDQFANKFKNLNLQKDDVEKQWRIYVAEQEEMERRWKNFLYEQESKQAGASPLSAGGSGGGGGNAAPVSTDETFLEFFVVEGSENWKYFLMNISGIQTELLDSGVPSDWQVNLYFAPVQKKGYAAVFNQPETQNFTFIMLNTAGTLIGSFTSNNGWHGDVTDGKAVIFSYPLNGGTNLIFFNGDTFLETFYAGADRLNLNSNWDYSTNDNKIVGTLEYPNSDRSVRLLDINGDIEIYQYNNNDSVLPSTYAYSFGNFVLIILFDNNNAQYTRLKILSTSGNIIQDVDLTSSPLVNLYVTFYGTNKLQLLFYTNSSNDDYKIYNYNGNTATFIATSQTRGNFDSFNVQSDNLYPYDEFSYRPESILNTFYNQFSYNGLIVTGHTKMTWLFEGNSSYNLYVFTDSGVTDKRIYPYGFHPTNESAATLVDKGDGYLTMLVLKSDGTVTEVQVILFSDMNGDTNFSADMCGSKMVIEIGLQSFNNRYKIYSSLGALLSSVDATSNSYFNTRFDIMYVNQYEDGNKKLWYFNNAVSSFTMIPQGSNQVNINDPFYETTTALNQGTYFFYFSSVPSVIILNKDSISSEILLPASGDSSGLELGKDKFVYYFTNEGGFIVVNLYDYNGNLINSVTTTFNNIYDLIAIEDRFVAIFNNGGNYTTYMITPTTLETIVVNSVDNEARMVNDFAFYDD